MKKKPEAIPLSSLFIERRLEPAIPFDSAKGGVVIDLADTTLKRLRFELSLPTMEPSLRQAIEEEIDRCASEFATRQRKQSAANAAGGRALKRNPHVTRQVLESFRAAFVYQHGSERGWMKAAREEYKITENTIRARLSASE